jgi:hypothetical protein
MYLCITYNIAQILSKNKIFFTQTKAHIAWALDNPEKIVGWVKCHSNPAV